MVQTSMSVPSVMWPCSTDLPPAYQMISPPSPKMRLWTNDELPRDPEEWRTGATEHRDTWWNDWSAWVAERAGELRTPPPTGNTAHPVLGDAPGDYVSS